MTLNPNARHGAEALSRQVKANVLPIPKPEKRERKPKGLKRSRRKREAIYAYACNFDGVEAACWLKQFSTKEKACEGRMDHAHLIDKAVLKREGFAHLCGDERTWVPACRWHHTQFDRRLGVTVPREALPPELLKLVEEIGLMWWIDRRYGERREVAA
jgi:hypothetical protein